MVFYDIYIYWNLCVCVHALYMHMRAYVCTYICVFVYMHALMHACMDAFMYAHMNVCNV